MMHRVLAVLVLTAAASALADAEVCSPFDKFREPANASVYQDHVADGGGPLGQDATMCCKGGAGGCIQRCPHTQAGQPVDTLTGFAWLDRTDIQLTQPWGPPVAFRRHYSTADAERAERTVVGPGWRHTYSGFLALAGPNPATRVILVLGERTSEEFNLVGGA
jgi:hypothetical protein